jgi:hypothetical protein
MTWARNWSRDGARSEGVHAQPVGQRRVDVEGLAGLALLRLLLQVAQRAHVVEAVGQLDDEHADVAAHRHDHLADRLGLGGVAVLDLVELGDAVDERSDLVAEVVAQLLEGVRRVLDRVVQEGRDQRRLGHADFGQDRRDRERVGDVGVAALAHLARVVPLGHRVGALEQLEVGLGVVGTDRSVQRLEDGVLRLALQRHASQTGAHPATGRTAGQPLARRRFGGLDRLAGFGVGLRCGVGGGFPGRGLGPGSDSLLGHGALPSTIRQVAPWYGPQSTCGASGRQMCRGPCAKRSQASISVR